MKKERIEYLDLIKGISILLVVFCHRVALSDETILGNIFMAIAWAAVPNFFFVTGGLMHQQQKFDWRKYTSKLVRAYLVLCVWKVLYLVFFSFLQEISFSKVDLIKYIVLFGDIAGVDTAPMWFMYAYIAVLLFFPISYYLFKSNTEGKKIIIFILIILFISCFGMTACNFFFDNLSKQIGCNLLQVSISAVVPFGAYSNMLFFFLMGAFLFGYREKIGDYLSGRAWRKWIPVLLLIVGLFGLVFVKYCETGLICWGGSYITNGYSRISSILISLGFYLILQGWHIRKAGHFLAIFVGTNTMGIYYLHMPILALCQMKLSMYYDMYGSFGANIIKTVVVAAVCIVITIILKRIPVIRELVK